MKKAFKTGNHVVWNSEAGRVGGTIIKVHRKDVDHKGDSVLPPRGLRGIPK